MTETDARPCNSRWAVLPGRGGSRRREAVGAAGVALFISAAASACGTPRVDPTSAAEKPAERVIAVTNGQWFDGHGFRPRLAYIVGESLSFRRPPHVDSTIDLNGGFAVPPYGEAHSHNVEPLNSPDSVVREYLAHGIFYVKNPNNLPGAKPQLAGRINVPTSIDVAFANGGLTATGGHPMEIVLRNISRGIWNRESGEGGFYWVIDSLPDLERKWPSILAQRPDFIKTYLLFSEEFAVRRADTAFFGWKGLDPRLLPQIVQRAHAAGLRVSTHIETAADFHNALMAGVDEINHMPGFRVMRDIRPHDDSIFRISEDDAKLAGARRTVVVTTLGGARRLLPEGPDSGTRRRYDSLHSRNLRLLIRFHVPLALGSDHYRLDAVDEALYLRELGALPPLTVLKAWCEATPRTVFPKRKIGALREGYEASFLVLAGDPLEDMGNLFRIRLRVKQGYVLRGPPSSRETER